MLKHKEAVVLSLLTRDGEKYGRELVEESDGQLMRGTVYVVLERMVQKGYVKSRQESSPRLPELARLLYRPTDVGRKALRAWVGNVVTA